MNPESNTSVVDPCLAPATPESRSRAATTKDDSSRCQHRYENGTRCRTRLVPSRSRFCPRHSHGRVAAGLPLSPAPSDFEDLSAELLGQLSEFKCAPDINQFLARLLILVTQGRVTPRRASVLAYITNQLLHSHRAIDREIQLEEDGPITVEIGDLPRPDRSQPYPGPDSQTVIDLSSTTNDPNKKPS